MPLIQELINQLDQLPNAEAQIKVFQVENGDAINLTQLLQELFFDCKLPQAQTPAATLSIQP